MGCTGGTTEGTTGDTTGVTTGVLLPVDSLKGSGVSNIKET